MDGPYAALLADPPWTRQQAGMRRPLYPLLSTEAIIRLPVGRLAAPAAHLWLWVTNASLFTGRQVMEAWGFSYRSCLTWIKPRYGLGPYLYAPLQEHRHKPEEQYAVIERCSPGPYLELFTRRPRLGWHVWGNEDDSNIDMGQLGWTPTGSSES